MPAFPAVTPAPQVGTNNGAAVLSSLAVVSSNVKNFYSLASSFSVQKGPFSDVGPLISSQSSLYAAVTNAAAAASSAQAQGGINETGGSSIVTAVNALITGPAGIKSLLNVVDGGAQYYSSDGEAGVVHSYLTSDQAAANSLASYLIADAPSDLKATASALSSTINSLFNSAIATFPA